MFYESVLYTIQHFNYFIWLHKLISISFKCTVTYVRPQVVRFCEKQHQSLFTRLLTLQFTTELCGYKTLGKRRGNVQEDWRKEHAFLLL
jgi:hypothetical protein